MRQRFLTVDTLVRGLLRTAGAALRSAHRLTPASMVARNVLLMGCLLVWKLFGMACRGPRQFMEFRARHRLRNHGAAMQAPSPIRAAIQPGDLKTSEAGGLAE